jgi:FolB domain-containing protein
MRFTIVRAVEIWKQEVLQSTSASFRITVHCVDGSTATVQLSPSQLAAQSGSYPLSRRRSRFRASIDRVSRQDGPGVRNLGPSFFVWARARSRRFDLGGAARPTALLSPSQEAPFGGDLDRILIRDLVVRCILGTNERERHDRQSVVINLAVGMDLSRAGASDNLADTLDYRRLRDAIIELAERSEFFLAEALAQKIAEACLAHPHVEEAQVTVEKPSALRGARSVGVEIVRRRSS